MSMDKLKELPEDILTKILESFPVKYLMRFRCVSKTWYDLIKSQGFIDGYHKIDRKPSLMLKRFPPRPPAKRWTRRAIRSFSKEWNDSVLSFHDLDFPHVVVSPDIVVPLLVEATGIDGHQHGCIYLMGPCNGLICLNCFDSAILFNPALREFKELPPRGFMYTDVKSEYKSSTNSWRQIHYEVPQISIFQFNLFFKGFIHWHVYPKDKTYPAFLTFHVGTETFGQLGYPTECTYDIWDEVSLKVLNNCLAMIRYEEYTNDPKMVEIWVMKEYGIQESWVKQFVIGPYLVTTALLFLENELLLVESINGQLASCSLYSNEFKKLQVYGLPGTLRATIYKESLIRPSEIILV